LKVAVLVPDGAADWPIEELGGKTPLEVAQTPNMDEVARRGIIGTVRTIPEGMSPGSDVANMSLMGYDPRRFLTGRAPIEAANLGIEIADGWTAFRCNLVTVEDDIMVDYSAGHIDQNDASGFIDLLNRRIADEKTRFYAGTSYRNILLLEGSYEGVECTPPHDIIGMPIKDHLPSGQGADLLISIMERSRDVFASCELNQRRKRDNLPQVSMVWLWGQGRKMVLESFEKRFGLKGGIISAVDLICGIGKLVGLRRVHVPGMTGYLDTNYAGKGDAAVEVLKEETFVFVHVEAPDEASHMGSIEEKIKAIERFDKMVVGRVLEYLTGAREESRIVVCPDHPTFISTRTHDPSPVPFALCGTGIPRGRFDTFSEKSAALSGIHVREGHELLVMVATLKAWDPRLFKA